MKPLDWVLTTGDVFYTIRPSKSPRRIRNFLPRGEVHRVAAVGEDGTVYVRILRMRESFEIPLWSGEYRRFVPAKHRGAAGLIVT